MKKNMMLCLLVGAAALVACSDAQVTVFPIEGKAYKIVTTSSSEADSLQASTKKAQEICAQQNKSYQVLSAETKYQGMDKQTRNAVDLAAMALSMTSKNPVVADTSRSDDYVTQMTFKCA